MIAKYITADDEVFDDLSAAEKHEEHLLSLLKEATCAYKFYDSVHKEMIVDTSSIETCIDSLDKIYGDCTFIDVQRELSEEAKDFIEDYFGFILPEKIGLNYTNDDFEWELVK